MIIQKKIKIFIGMLYTSLRTTFGKFNFSLPIQHHHQPINVPTAGAQATPCFRRHVKPLVPAAFAGGFWPCPMCNP
jgi:hypothetical protein